jgi:hypothetical protein
MISWTPSILISYIQNIIDADPLLYRQCLRARLSFDYIVKPFRIDAAGNQFWLKESYLISKAIYHTREHDSLQWKIYLSHIAYYLLIQNDLL